MIRIDFASLSVTERDEQGNPVVETRHRLVLTPHGFLKTFENMERMVHKLVGAGMIETAAADSVDDGSGKDAIAALDDQERRHRRNDAARVSRTRRSRWLALERCSASRPRGRDQEAGRRCGHEGRVTAAQLGGTRPGRVRFQRPLLEPRSAMRMSGSRPRIERTYSAAWSCTATATASGPANGRSWLSAGIMLRASATLVGSTSAVTKPESVPPSASTRPQGSTTRECP